MDFLAAVTSTNNIFFILNLKEKISTSLYVMEELCLEQHKKRKYTKNPIYKTF